MLDLVSTETKIAVTFDASFCSVVTGERPFAPSLFSFRGSATERNHPVSEIEHPFPILKGLPHNPERIDYLLQRLALHAHRNKQVSQLSGGMKRRLLIAKALIHSPPLLFLDEPTARVDVALRNTLWDSVSLRFKPQLSPHPAQQFVKKRPDRGEK